VGPRARSRRGRGGCRSNHATQFPLPVEAGLTGPSGISRCRRNDQRAGWRSGLSTSGVAVPDLYAGQITTWPADVVDCHMSEKDILVIAEILRSSVFPRRLLPGAWPSSPFGPNVSARLFPGFQALAKAVTTDEVAVPGRLRTLREALKEPLDAIDHAVKANEIKLLVHLQLFIYWLVHLLIQAFHRSCICEAARMKNTSATWSTGSASASSGIGRTIPFRNGSHTELA